jgi:hypothetical protein
VARDKDREIRREKKNGGAHVELIVRRGLDWTILGKGLYNCHSLVEFRLGHFVFST